MNIKTTHSNPTTSNVTVLSQRARGQEARVPLVITSNSTPHPHQPEPKAHPKTRVKPHYRPFASRLGCQSLIAAARSRDGDPLT
jgi:hypothetical protein